MHQAKRNLTMINSSTVPNPPANSPNYVMLILLYTTEFEILQVIGLMANVVGCLRRYVTHALLPFLKM